MEDVHLIHRKNGRSIFDNAPIEPTVVALQFSPIHFGALRILP
jgi:hypothetical protein